MTCVVCSVEFRSSSRHGVPRKYCGDTCKWRSRDNKTEKRKRMLLEASAKWAASNRQKSLESKRRWEASHPEYKEIRLKKQRDRRRAHPEREVAHRHKYYASKRAAGGSYTASEWRALLDASGHRCLCCGKTDVKLTVDHVIPVSMGGSSDIGNLQPLCVRCNCKKYNRTLDFRSSAGSTEVRANQEG